MAEGIHYPILLNAPKKVEITAKQFDKLSYIGLASFFCSYKAVIEKDEEKKQYLLYMLEGECDRFFQKGRFTGLKWRIWREAEMVACEIPFDHQIAKTIENYFSHLIMENEKDE